MDDEPKNITNICQLLKMYSIAEEVSPHDISDFKVYKSNLYGMVNIFSFVYENRHYYVSDDYSLMDNPTYMQNVLEDINPTIQGKLIENPVPQSDGAKYALCINGTEYYLWEVDSK